MRKRTYNMITASVSSGVLLSKEQAVKEANAIKGFIKRLCNKNGYNVKAKIGVSINNAKCGNIENEKTGKRGRPKKVFTPNGNVHKMPIVAEPHIHIWVEGEGANSVIKELAHHLNTKYGKQVLWHKKCEADNYADNAKTYLDKQCISVRTIDTCTDRIF